MNQEILKVERLHKEGSFGTQRSRKMMVRLIARQLDEEGYRGLQVKNLKPKHVDALVGRWHREGISVGTFKNRMGVLRWIFGKVQRHFLMDRSNAAYGIANRRYATNENKARELTPAFGDIERIRSPHVRMSLELQRAFGLRREEALKIQPGWADRGSKLLLLGSWTKGGRGREVPIRTKEQREVLDRAKRLAGTCSGLRTSGVVLENNASFGSDYLRTKQPLGSHYLRMSANYLRRAHLVENDTEHAFRGA